MRQNQQYVRMFTQWELHNCALVSLQNITQQASQIFLLIFVSLQHKYSKHQFVWLDLPCHSSSSSVLCGSSLEWLLLLFHPHETPARRFYLAGKLLSSCLNNHRTKSGTFGFSWNVAFKSNPTLIDLCSWRKKWTENCCLESDFWRHSSFSHLRSSPQSRSAVLLPEGLKSPRPEWMTHLRNPVCLE